MKIIPILKGHVFTAKQLQKAIDRSLNNAALGAQADYDTTVMTWSSEHQPEFGISAPTKQSRVIGTSDKPFIFIDQGTKVRYVTMTRGFKAKTRPGFVGSGAGAGGVLFFSKKKPRPGIVPRRFSEIIAAKWQRQFPILLESALASMIGG